jgi:LPS export ABC transporter protein LptC
MVYITVLAFALCFIAGCSSQSDNDVPAEKSTVGQPDQVMTNSEIYLTRYGRRSATIKSNTLKVYQRIDTTLLYGVEARFFDSSGVQTSTLTADSGWVSQKRNTMSVAGHVKAHTSDNRRLVTDSLRWNANDDKVETEGYVEVYKNNDKITGNGLETDQRLEKVVIKKNLKGSFSEPKSTNH